MSILILTGICTAILTSLRPDGIRAVTQKCFFGACSCYWKDYEDDDDEEEEKEYGKDEDGNEAILMMIKM